MRRLPVENQCRRVHVKAVNRIGTGRIVPCMRVGLEVAADVLAYVTGPLLVDDVFQFEPVGLHLLVL